MENKKNMLKKYKFIFMIFLCFVLCFAINSNIVNANYYWGGEANSNYYMHSYDSGDLTGVEQIGFASNYANPMDSMVGSDYKLCSIPYSDYAPIVANFGNLGSSKVVITDASTGTLKFYNPDCSLFREIDITSGTIRSPPVLVNPKSYQAQQIAVLVREGVGSYLKIINYTGDDFALGIGDFEVVKTIQSGSNYINGLSCFNHNYGNDLAEKCLVTEYSGGSQSSIWVTNIETGSQVEYGLAFGQVYGTGATFASLNNIRTNTGLIDKEKFYITQGYLYAYSDNRYLRMSLSSLIIEENKTDVFDSLYLIKKDINYGSDVYSPNPTIYESSSYMAKLGNNPYIFISDLTTSSSLDYYWSNNIISDLEGNVRIEVKSYVAKNLTSSADNITNKMISNWVVADYNKDGDNEACILIKPVTITGTNETWLQCYEETLSMGDGDIRVNYSIMDSEDIIGGISNFVMADFVTGKDVLGIATREGIYYPDEQVFSTGFDAGFGYPVVIFRDVYSKIPMLVFSSDDLSFIVTSFNITGVLCGNGICEIEHGETELSCPVDCWEEIPKEAGEYLVGTHCESDSDCAGNLKCEYGVCSLAGFNEECSTNAECLSGECVAGYCTKSGLWALLSASKTQQFGDDTHTNNFISLIIIISVASAVGIYLNIWGGIMVLFSLGIFFTLVGWLSAFILVGFFIVGIIALVFGMMLPKR